MITTMLNPKSVETVHQEIVALLRTFFQQAGCTDAVLGLSGGIDSALVAALAVEALGPEHVTGILMPSQFSTMHSINDAVELSNNLGIKYHIVPIEKIYTRYMQELVPTFDWDNRWDNTQENLQARIRGTILMAYSNRHGALVMNTSNKSEMAMGYGTLYGDLCGALMVLGDLYKVEVYELSRYINRQREIIPESTLTKAPSAELRDDQKDSDTLPDYAVLDPILHALHEEGKSPEELIAGGADAELVERILRLKKASRFKAHQLPPVLKVSEKPLLDSSKWITL